ncbi:hypothetical protein [Neptuniibacter sp. QD37_11]|uniref:hypothetical protein n=1 Tax=Neptuniibacter sp. QD37_11 TaxID=3398209 RepID=UPI0039F5F74E
MPKLSKTFYYELACSALGAIIAFTWFAAVGQIIGTTQKEILSIDYLIVTSPITLMGFVGPIVYFSIMSHTQCYEVMEPSIQPVSTR